MEQFPAIKIQGLIKSYGSVQALHGVDLDVHQGEIFGFLGPNGAGKTTTIRCLLDLIRPDAGTLRVLGIDPQKDPVSVHRRVGYLPGELQFDQNMRVGSALRFLNSIKAGAADWDYILQLAERLDLDLKPAIRNLSKGNKQKVGLIQALMHKPELLLLDEPTFGLDPLVQQEVHHLIMEAKRAGATVFFSSHILSEVQEIAELVGIIRNGVVVEVAQTDSLVNRAIRHVRVRFKDEVNPEPLAALPGVEILGKDNSTTLFLQVSGEMDSLIKSLAGFPIIDLETQYPTLEEIFLEYYKDVQGNLDI